MRRVVFFLNWYTLLTQNCAEELLIFFGLRNIIYLLFYFFVT